MVYLRMKRLVILLLCVFSWQTWAQEHSQTPVRMSTAEYQTRILYYVNAYRAKHHLPALQMKSTISKIAALHSHDMANHRTAFGHTGFNGRIKRLYQQYDSCRGAAENVAFYRLDPKRLVDAWVASPGHRRNIEGHYNLTGIGIAYGKKGWAYYTQIFLSSAS